MDRDRPHQSALRKSRYSVCNRIYLITTVTSRRDPVFRVFRAGRIVVNEMRSLEVEGRADTLAWVLIPDHMHWLMQLGVGQTLARVIKILKGRSSRILNQNLKRKGAVWQSAYHDHAVRCDEDLNRLARYIVANPLRAGIVTSVGDYPLWDCVWL
jgi:putative transposase